LGSAYILGGTHEHLNDIYDKEAEQLEPWKDSPGEITDDDWRDFLGKREYVPSSVRHVQMRRLTHCRYQRAFIDFFEDQLVSRGYDWKLLLNDFLFEGKEPLINGMISGREYVVLDL